MGPGRAARRLQRCPEQRRRAERPHLAADLAALVAHLPAQGQDVAGDHAAGVEHDVAPHGH